MSELQEIKKEFELERMILFSDAVFAIAITLLILEVKFPVLHKGMSPAQIAEAFEPVYPQLLAFVISFFFIGIMWAKHLEIFRYLRNYDKKIIFINLLFLFFIVCFPFSASAFSENTHSQLALPLLVYLGNITSVSLVKAVLAYYLFHQENKNTVPGHEIEKRMIYLESLWSSLIVLITFVLMLIMSFFYDGDPLLILWPFYLLAFMSVIMNKRLKKYKAKRITPQQTESPFLDI